MPMQREVTMEEVRTQMKTAFADVFSLYLKTANFHWNVEGFDFYQMHKLFETIYTDVYDSIDPMAEQIRTLGTYTPASFSRFQELSSIEDANKPLSAQEMLDALYTDNQTVITSLTAALKAAQGQNLQGLMNFLAGRIEQHNKWAWFLRASKKGN
jgi:starvation-inducible DNA-binding protein